VVESVRRPPDAHVLELVRVVEHDAERAVASRDSGSWATNSPTRCCYLGRFLRTWSVLERRTTEYATNDEFRRVGDEVGAATEELIFLGTPPNVDPPGAGDLMRS
jgi:hypothetical protein